MNDKFIQPPVTSRGVVTPNDFGFSIENQRLVIDWCQFTIFDQFDYTPYDYFYNLFGVQKENIIYEVGALFGYTYTYSYKNIKLFVSDKEEMGFHFYLTGTACRDFEDLGKNWIVFFKFISKYTPSFTRLDVAIDDFSNKYFNLFKLKRYVSKGYVCSKFKTDFEVLERCLSDGSTKGNTLQFGSKASLVQVTFYDKYLERFNNGYEVSSDVTSWVRTEIRFRKERATEVVYRMIDSNDLTVLIKSILFNYIRFLSFKNSIEFLKRKDRCEVADWWLSFLDNVEKLRLTSINIEPTITKKIDWLINCTSKSQFMVLCSQIENFSLDDMTSDFLYKLLKSGFSKNFTEKDLSIINDYRMKNHMDRISFGEIFDYFDDIKNISIHRD